MEDSSAYAVGLPAPQQDGIQSYMLSDMAEWRAPNWMNRTPTPQELLELSHRVYKHSRRLYSEADAQGLRVYHDERLDGSDVRVVMLVPSWFPRPHVSLDAVMPRLEGDSVTVAVVVRGTVRDLVGNTIANLQLLFNKLIDDQYIPDATDDATKVIQGWLLELMARHPELRPQGAAPPGGFAGPEWTEGGVGGRPAGRRGAPARRLRLDVSITGHSLGGLIAEAATVESARFADAHGVKWRCVSFESPGLPQHYLRAAAQLRPGPGAWDETIRGYLAAPNPINMLYPHLGTVVHVLAQWEQTWSHVAKCVGADALRIAGWVAVASLTGAAITRVTNGGGGGARRRQDDDDRGPGLPIQAPPQLARPQPVIASVAEGPPRGSGRVMFASMTASNPNLLRLGNGAGGGGGSALADAAGAAAGGGLSRQQCLAAHPLDGAGAGGRRRAARRHLVSRVRRRRARLGRQRGRRGGDGGGAAHGAAHAAAGRGGGPAGGAGGLDHWRRRPGGARQVPGRRPWRGSRGAGLSARAGVHEAML